MYDVLIIGSGAGGGGLALRLSQAGAKVLVLEKGPRHSASDFPQDEISNFRRNFWVPDIELEPHMVQRAGASGAFRSTLGWAAICLGGGTTHMGAYLYRFHPDDFRLRSRLGPYAEIVDWPYTYEELEPFYVEAEWELGVSGVNEPPEIGIPRSRALPLPPLEAHPMAFELDRVCQQLGLHPYDTPRSINSRAYSGRPPCSYCPQCAGFGCRTDARGTSAALIRRAEATGNCKVVTHANVVEITSWANGLAKGCRYLDAEGHEHQEQARIVCVCCSSVESARLLLVSKSPLFPDGLGNSNGLVGRWLQFHVAARGEARFGLGPHNRALWQDEMPFLGRSILDHYFLPADVTRFAKGGILRFDLPQRGVAIASAQRLALSGSRVLWGESLRSRLRECFLTSRRIEFETFQDYIPNRTTFMDLDPTTRDCYGTPVARIHLDPDPHHEVASKWLQDRALDILDRMGADELIPGVRGEILPFLVLGTCRAGHDPSSSVLDPYCRSHEVPNLFVVDGSFMPTSGGAAPTLTILANAFRVAAHMASEAKSGNI